MNSANPWMMRLDPVSDQVVREIDKTVRRRTGVA